MTLLLAQKQAIKAYIQANLGSQSDEGYRDAMNAAATPAFLVYRKDVPVGEIMQNGFDWTRVDNLSAGKSRIWEWMTQARKVNDEFVLDFTKPNNRAGINETWKGTAPDLAVRAVVYAHGTRIATVAEKLFATGAGTAPDVDGNGPATAVFSGLLTTQDIIDSLNS